MDDNRLPPGQQLAAPGKWPLVGERQPAPGDGPWRLTVEGCVGDRQVWTLDQIQAMPQVERVEDIHCVTRWSKLGVRFRGVSLSYLLERAVASGEARFVSFVARSPRQHSTSLPLADALALETLVAVACDDQPLPVERGGPLRVIVPRRYFYKSLKWLTRIELLAEDRLGFWERTAGYHNVADPWQQQRYMAPSVTRQQAARLLADRDFAGRDLRGLNAAGRDLSGLQARGALLRDADFRDCCLRAACFDQSNLSNAHFQGAYLRGASFIEADVEGADFTAADLRQADLRGASLLGASFQPHRSQQGTPSAPVRPALLDSTTRIHPSALEQLTPEQAHFVRQALRT